MKSIGLLIISLCLSSGAMAQEKKKKSLKKNPKKDERYAHLKGKNQNKIVYKYLFKNLVGGKGHSKGSGGKEIVQYEQDFFRTGDNVNEKRAQWIENKRKLLSGERITGLDNVWTWNDGDGLGNSASKTCDEVCPDSLEMLSVNTPKFLREQEHFLSFRNREEDMMDSYKRLYGYCWGHSSFSASLKMFTFFDPKNKSGQDVPVESDTDKWVKFYEKIIKNLGKNEAQIIPYFSNINEMSSHPKLQVLFKDEVAKRWGRVAVRKDNYKNLDHMFKTAPSYLDFENIFIKLQIKIASLQSPRINFHRFGSKAYSHVVTVIGVEKFKEGRYKIYVEDPNVFPINSPMYQKYIEIQPEAITRAGGVKIYATYNFYDTDSKKIEKGQKPLARGHVDTHIGKIQILDESDPFHEHAIGELRNFCIKNSNCQK